jgi:23S rRNA (uridine2552-2'-O)-methyltransferase
VSAYDKPDSWSLKAQKAGYPARSVYKLEEIDGKFRLLTPPRGGNPRVLDLGAAPGSWSLYILRHYPGAFLAAADLQALSRRYDGDRFDGPDFFFIQGDFTSPPVREELLRRGPYTAIVSDAAPATTGSRTVDVPRSLALAEEVLLYADQCLAPGGNLAVKVFQGPGAAELLGRLRRDFTGVRAFKPAACRGDSFETYYIGLGKRSKVEV